MYHAGLLLGTALQARPLTKLFHAPLLHTIFSACSTITRLYLGTALPILIHFLRSIPTLFTPVSLLLKSLFAILFLFYTIFVCPYHLIMLAFVILSTPLHKPTSSFIFHLLLYDFCLFQLLL